MILSGICVVLFSLLAANPNKVLTHSTQERQGIDIVLVLDLSYSMMAEDIEPNRFLQSKQVLMDFISQLENDRVGLVIFAGKPFVWVPLTFDYQFLQKYISDLEVESINQNYSHLQWTAIWDAMLYGGNLFDTQEREQVLVVFTDGEANRWIRPLDALRFLREENITIHTVWIGWYEPTFVYLGNEKIDIWWVDEEVLQSIAEITGWKYFRASDEATFSKLFSELDLLEKKNIEVQQILVYQPLYQKILWILWWVLLIFLSFQGWYFIRN